MKLEVSKRSIERDKQAIKRAQQAGYSGSRAKTLLRKYYREGNDDSAKLDDWIRKNEKQLGNRMIPKFQKRKKAKEFSEDEIREKEKELAQRVFDGREFGIDLDEFSDLELKAAAKSLGLNVKGNLSKKGLIKKIDDALCKPPECSREEPKYLKEISKQIVDSDNKQQTKTVKSKSKPKMKKKMKKKAKVQKKVDKLPIKKSISGVLKKGKLRKVTIAEILPFTMPKMF